MANNSTVSTPRTKKNSQNIESIGRKSSSGKPTPLDFDTFIPWICLQMQVPKLVVVRKIMQEKCKKQERKTSSTRTRSAKSIKFHNADIDSDATHIYTEPNALPIGSTPKKVSVEQTSIDNNVFSLKASYDSRGYLVEVAIINSPFKIHRKIIQAINLCVPFHAFLTKLVIRGHGATFILLQDIGKLLPHSNLTYICLDNSCVPECNYYVLLDQKSQLKSLFLNRCNITDEACKEIAIRIDFDKPAYSTLVVLELSCNLITDSGAQYFGNTLKMNRRLLHLNLAGNKITDEGANIIFKHLMEFEISGKEARHAVYRKKNYVEKKGQVLETCMEEVIRRKLVELSTSSTTKRSKSTKIKKANMLNSMADQSIADLAEKMTKEIMGEFEDPFCVENVVKKDNKYFSTGNMNLCSLNLSYNNLEYPSIKMIAEVLKYQSQTIKPEGATGLLRIVIEGNLIPSTCAEYKIIDSYLNKMINDRLPINISGKRRSSSISKK